MRKNSWLPVALALLLPLILLLFAYTTGIRLSDGPGVTAPPIAPQTANLLLKVENQQGEAVAGEKVTILHLIEGGPYPTQSSSSTPLEATTDTAGMATLSLPKQGSVKVTLASGKSATVLLDLDKQEGTIAELKLTRQE